MPRRLLYLFIALVQESASLNLENIRKVRSYVGSLLDKQWEQRTGEFSVMPINPKDLLSSESSRNNPITRCAFCGRADDQVQRMIQGAGVCICDDCVYLCLQVLHMSLDW